MAGDDALDGLAAIAVELYGLPLGDFTTARNARAKAVRADDRALAERIATLPKPSVAAWAVNLLVRERTDEIAQLLELGETLRRAQEQLDSAALRAMTAQRRAIVSALASQTASLAASRGHRLSAAVVGEVEQTLTAALADPAAGEAVRGGALVRSLEAVGFEPVDLAGATAVSTAGGGVDAGRPASRPGGRSASTRPAPVELADERRRREREAARRAAEEAQADADAARATVDEVDARLAAIATRLDEATADRDRLTERMRELQARLDDLDDELFAHERDRDRAQRERLERSRAADAVEDAARRARRQAERLEE